MREYQFIIENMCSKHDPTLDKANRALPQYSFDDVVEVLRKYGEQEFERGLDKATNIFVEASMILNRKK